MKLEYCSKKIFPELKQGKDAAFKHIYDLYWPGLYKFAYNIIRDKATSEEIVQEVFLSLWNARQNLQITHSLQAYLFSAIKFQTLNYMRAAKVRTHYADSFAVFKHVKFDNSNEENINYTDLKKHIEIEIAKLPTKCQEIFRMSRSEHKSIQNISDLLNISHKTVENQLSKALKHLRSSLGEFLILFFAFIISI